MTLPRQVHYPGITPAPCTVEQTNRNWDALRRFMNQIGEDTDTDTGAVGVVIFELAETLEPGGSASATTINFSGGLPVTGDSITVHDETTGEVWSGLAGYRGIARRREPDTTDYVIVWLERIAYMVRGMLLGSLVGGSASLTVAAYSDGVDPGATVTVYDPGGHWPDSVSGGDAIALYNFTEQRYEVVKCEQSEWIATATALQNFDQSTPVVSIGNVIFKTLQEYTPDPATPGTALNTFGLSGVAGTILHIQKSKASGLWEILVPDATSGSTALPVHRFRLTSNLQIGGFASGRRLGLSGGTYVELEAIIVLDRPYSVTPQTPGGLRGMWSGMASMEGWARKRGVSQSGEQEYEIIWMEQFGRFIFGTLTEDMGATTDQQASGTIDYLFGQGDGLTQNEITVHDDQDLYPFALSGAKFFAVRNEYLNTDHPETPYYQIVVCQQPYLFGQAQLGEDMCPDDASRVITQFRGWTPSIFNQGFEEGKPDRASNTFALAGISSDKVLLAGQFKPKDEENEQEEEIAWHIVQVEHHKDDIVFDIRESGDWIQAKMAECAVMRCEDPEWRNKIPLTNCEPEP